MGTVAKYGIEAGEITAPVSKIYTNLLLGMLEEAFWYKEESLWKLNILLFKNLLKSDIMFSKTSKKFQEEFQTVLDYPFEKMYEVVMRKPFHEEVTISVDTNVEAKLTLVK